MFAKSEEEITKFWRDCEKPKVSIITHSYNHEKYIEQALNGFLMQETNFSFEILIHDDASTDETAKIIKNYQKRYPNVIKPTIQTENQYSKGIHTVFKKFIDSANAKYIAMCECDDYWTDKTKLQQQFDFLENNLDYSMCYHKTLWMDNVNKTSYMLIPNDANCEDLIRKNVVFHTSSCFFRNLITPLPFEYNLLKGGDFFITSLLGNYGKGKYLKDIGHSVYSRNEKGITNTDKQTNYVNNFMDKMTTYSYYNRIGKKEYADYYLNLAIKVILCETSMFKLAKYFVLRPLQKTKNVIIKMFSKINYFKKEKIQ